MLKYRMFSRLSMLRNRNSGLGRDLSLGYLDP